MKKYKILVLLYIFIILLVLLYHTSPSVNSGDSGEFITTSCTLGIAHSPGYPLHSLLGKVFSVLIPFGNYAYRVNLSNVLLTMLAFVIVLLWSEKYFLQNYDKVVVSVLSFSTLVFSLSYLRNTLQTEVFILNALFCITIVFLAYNFRSVNSWYEISLLSGLALGNHHTIIFLFPGLLYLYFQNKFFLRNLLYSVVFFVIGFSINFVMPIRSSKQPYFNWGNTKKLYNLYRVITRKDYGTFQLTIEKPLERSFKNVILQTRRFVFTTVKDISLILFLLGIVSLYVLYIKNKQFFIFLLISYILSGIGFIILANLPFEPIHDGILERFYILPNSILTCSLIVSLFYLTRDIVKILIFLLTFSTVFNCVRNLHVCSYRNYYLNYDYGINILHTLLPNSILFMDGGDDTFYTLGYLQAVEKRRQDVSLHDRGGLVFKNIYGEDFRKLTKEEKEKRRIYIEQSFVKKRPVFYSTFNKEILPGYKLSYAGVLYVVDDGKLPTSYRDKKFFNEIYSYRAVYTDYYDYRSRALVPVYFFMESANEEDVNESFKLMKLLLIKWSDIDWLKNNIIVQLHNTGYKLISTLNNYNLAKKVYDFILDINEKDLTAWLNLGVVYEKLNMIENAEMCYRKVLQIDPYNATAYYNLGVIYWKKNDWDKVIECFSKVLAIQPQNEYVKNYLNQAVKRKQAIK